MRELCQIFDISPRGEEPGQARHRIVLPVNSDPITDTETDRTGTLRPTGQISILPTQDLRIRTGNISYLVNTYLLAHSFVPVMSLSVCEHCAQVDRATCGPVDHPVTLTTVSSVTFYQDFSIKHSRRDRREWPTSALNAMVNIKLKSPQSPCLTPTLWNSAGEEKFILFPFTKELVGI